ncbi:MAG: 30S ribosomal protein S17 [Chloroflexi bacterium]|nr:30S ribosomal protein S17 [Chloroflexota bacterium]
MPNTRRRLTGRVVSNKMDKTAVVRVEYTSRHPLYGKVIRTAKRYMAHDENNECQIGDEVVIVESRPISKNKRWVVQEILREDLSARATDVSDLEEVELGEEAADEDQVEEADETADEAE